MWPDMEQEILFSKLDQIRDLLRIAYSIEGENRARLFETARSMIEALGKQIETQEVDDDE